MIPRARNLSFFLPSPTGIWPISCPHPRMSKPGDTVPCFTLIYYVASSMSEQDEPNHAMWLATRAGTRWSSSGLPAESRMKNFPLSQINPLTIEAFSVKMVGYWPWSFCEFMDLNCILAELGQYPAILTSRLVSNPYTSHLSNIDHFNIPKRVIDLQVNTLGE